MLRKCDNCGNEYNADMRNVNRGWGLCCSKSCAASKREKSRPNYDPKIVAANNFKRIHGGIDENGYGAYRGRRTSEGYKIYGNTAMNEWDEPMYEVDQFEDMHPHDSDNF